MDPYREMCVLFHAVAIVGFQQVGLPRICSLMSSTDGVFAVSIITSCVVSVSLS